MQYFLEGAEAMNEEFKLPDLPTAARVEMTVSNLLTVAKLLSGVGLGIGAVLTTMPHEKLSAIVTLGIFGLGTVSAIGTWVASRWQHYRMAKDKRDSEVAAAVASAQISVAQGVPTPVVVAVTPADQENVVVPVPVSRITSAIIAGKMAPTSTTNLN